MLNQCNFIGRLGADPEVKRTQSGKPIVNIRLAVSKKWKDGNGEKIEKTTWVPVVIFSEGLCRVAEQYLSKGSLIFVSGELNIRKWTDQNGQDRYSTEVVLQGFNATLTMLDGRDDNSGSRSAHAQSGDSYAEASGASAGGGLLDDEIPFAPEWR